MQTPIQQLRRYISESSVRMQSVYEICTLNLRNPDTDIFGLLHFIARVVNDDEELHINAIDASLFLRDNSMTLILLHFFQDRPVTVSEDADGFTYLRGATKTVAWFRPDPAWIAVSVGPHFSLQHTLYPGVLLMPTPEPRLHVQGQVYRRGGTLRFRYLHSRYPTLQALQHDLLAAERISDPHCGLPHHVGVCAYTIAYARGNLARHASTTTDQRFILCARGTDDVKTLNLMRTLFPLDTFSLRIDGTQYLLYQHDDAGEITAYIIYPRIGIDEHNNSIFIIWRRPRPLYSEPLGPKGVRCCEEASGPMNS